MGRLLLCKNPCGESPLFIEELGIRLYSLEELCYYIFHHTILIDSSFLDEPLFSFIGTECKSPELEEKVRKWIGDKVDYIQILLMIMQDIHYYDEEDLRDFYEQSSTLRYIRPWERIKAKADYMLENRKMESALHLYAQAIPEKIDQNVSKDLLAGIYQGMGTAYTNLFQWPEAAASFRRAYEYAPSEDILRKFYMLSLLYPDVQIGSDIAAEVDPELLEAWQDEFVNRKAQAKQGGKKTAVDALRQRDSYRRKKVMNDLLNSWKKEYRELVR